MRAAVDYYIQGEDPRNQPNPDFVPFMDQRFVTELVGLTLSHPEFPFNYLARSTAQVCKRFILCCWSSFMREYNLLSFFFYYRVGF